MKKSLIVTALFSEPWKETSSGLFQKDSDSHLCMKKRSAAKERIEGVMLYSNNKCKAREVSDETQGLGASLQRQSSSATGESRLWM